MTQLLLVDDHTLVRSGFKLIFEGQEDLVVIEEAENGKQALDYLANATQIDLILTDIHMDIMHGLQLIQQVKVTYPATKVIVLSMDEKITTVYEALANGADGYLLKSAHVDEILFGIRQVLKGQQYISSSLSIELIKRAGQYSLPDIDKNEIMAHYEISECELSILELIAEGYTNADIADRIFLGKRTVEGHRQLLIEKTNSKNTAGLIRFGFQKKLLT